MTFKSLFKRKLHQGVSSKWLQIAKESAPETVRAIDFAKESAREATESTESVKEPETHESSEEANGRHVASKEEETRDAVFHPHVTMNDGLYDNAGKLGVAQCSADDLESSAFSVQPFQSMNEQNDIGGITTSHSDDSSVVIDIDDFEDSILVNKNFVHLSSDGNEVEIEATEEIAPFNGESEERDICESFGLSRVYRPFTNAASVAEAQAIMKSTRVIKPAPSSHQEIDEETRQEISALMPKPGDEDPSTNSNHFQATTEKESVSVVGTSFNVSDEDLREIDEFLKMCVAEEEKRERQAEAGGAFGDDLLPVSLGVQQVAQEPEVQQIVPDQDDESTIDIFKSIEESENKGFVDFGESPFRQVPMPSEIVVVDRDSKAPEPVAESNKNQDSENHAMKSSEAAVPPAGKKSRDVDSIKGINRCDRRTLTHASRIEMLKHKFEGQEQEGRLELTEAESEAELLGEKFATMAVEDDQEAPEPVAESNKNPDSENQDMKSSEADVPPAGKKSRDVDSIKGINRCDRRTLTHASRIEMLKHKFEGQEQEGRLELTEAESEAELLGEKFATMAVEDDQEAPEPVAESNKNQDSEIHAMKSSEAAVPPAGTKLRDVDSIKGINRCDRRPLTHASRIEMLKHKFEGQEQEGRLELTEAESDSIKGINRRDGRPLTHASRIEMLKQKFEGQKQGTDFPSKVKPEVIRGEMYSKGEVLSEPTAVKSVETQDNEIYAKMSVDDESILSIGYTAESTSIQSVGLADDTFDTDYTSDIQSIGFHDDMSEDYSDSDSDSDYDSRNSILESDYKRKSSRGASDDCKSEFSDEFIRISRSKSPRQSQRKHCSPSRSGTKKVRPDLVDKRNDNSDYESQDGRIVDFRRSSRRSDSRRDDYVDEAMEMQRHRRRLV